MTTGSPPSMTAITELVVPRSMPTVLAIRKNSLVVVVFEGAVGRHVSSFPALSGPKLVLQVAPAGRVSKEDADPHAPRAKGLGELAQPRPGLPGVDLVQLQKDVAALSKAGLTTSQFQAALTTLNQLWQSSVNSATRWPTHRSGTRSGPIVFSSCPQASDPQRAARLGYTHLMSNAKSHPAVGLRIEERARREDPAFYHRCEQVLMKNSFPI